MNLKWTDKLPMEPGWYFRRVFWNDGSVTVEVFNVSQEGIDAGWFVKDKREQWAGPIPEPDEA